MMGGLMGKSWITSTLGYAVIVLTWLEQIISEQGLPATGKDWLGFLLKNVVGLIGIFAKDFNRTGGTVPALEGAPMITPTKPLVTLIPLLVIGLLVSGCASYIDYGDGRYGVTKVSEQRSPFGTNGGFMHMENCKGEYSQEKFGLVFTECHPVTPLTPITSQGVGGQIVGGALTGLGFGLGSAFSGAGGASSSSSSSAITTAPAHGGHH
ncbi:MAG: hypothetical protein D4R44_08150 [Actinobacteria bacterium]|nr:MAG: hypothetical protein D4R44_08150 [Actinomycetota bacterium]